MKTVTSIQVHDPVVLTLEDPNLWNYPWIYLVEPGNLRLKETEVPILREFLLRGGTLTFDDFHGPIEWLNLEREMKRVFPDRKIVELPAGASDLPLLLRPLRLSRRRPGSARSCRAARGRRAATPRTCAPSKTMPGGRWC